MKPLDAVLERLEGVKRNGEGYMAKCPAHGDKNPSLSVTETQDGAVLLHCFAGCETNEILGSIGLEASDLFEQKRETEDNWTPCGPMIASYPYTDEHGKLLYTVCRTAGKEFPVWRPDPSKKHGKAWSLPKETRHVLYRLPKVLEEVAQSGIVYLAEGEKDAEALERAGVVATCNPGGAGKWRPEYSETLEGARVVLVAHRDDAGRGHAAKVAGGLEGKAASVTIVEAREGNDAADHLAAGHGLDAFIPVSLKAAAVQESAPFVDWSTFWDRDWSLAEWAYPDVFARGRGHAVYASHKTGKSLLALYVAAKLATGTERIVCIYLDYEMSQEDLFDRLEDMGYGPGTDLSRLKYALLPTLPPLDTPAGADALMQMVDGVQAEWPDYHLVVIIDTISRAVAGEENSADTFRDFYANTGIELKRRGLTWARLDHGGKDPTKGQRGSSGKGDDVDVVWRLERTQNGVCLHRDLARMPWVPEKVTFGISEDPLSFRRLAEDWPTGTKEVAQELDRLQVPPAISIKAAQLALKDSQVPKRRLVVAAAQRWRRERGGEAL